MRFWRSRKGAFGLVVLLALVFVALFAPLLAPYGPNEIHLNDQLAAPSAQYLFGTDEVGRDVLSRVIYSARPAISAGLVTVALAALVGATRVATNRQLQRFQQQGALDWHAQHITLLKPAILRRLALL